MTKEEDVPDAKGNFAFIGIGAMGYPMAMNIRKKKLSPSFTLYINDVNQTALDKFIKEAAGFGPVEIVKTAKEATENADTIISIVPEPKHVKAVYLDPINGAIAAKGPSGKLFVECSTIDAATTRQVGEAIQNSALGDYIDSPVSGGVPGAAAGTLSFMMGRTEDSALVPRLKSVVALMGRLDRLFFCGPLGAGVVAKAANNYLSGTILLASAEAMNFAIRSGLDKHILYRLIHESTGQSFMFDVVNPVPGVAPYAPSSRNYEGGFRAEMMVKDMSLGINIAKEVGARIVTGPAALELYKEVAVDERCIGRDVSVVYRFLEGPED